MTSRGGASVPLGQLGPMSLSTATVLQLTEGASRVYNGVMNANRRKEPGTGMTFEEAKRIHRREVREIQQGRHYRGKSAKAMGLPYLDEVIEAEDTLSEFWDPTTMSWRKLPNEGNTDLPT